MDELRFTLLTDGSSDDALIPILTWALAQQRRQTAIQPQWGDLRHLRERCSGLEARIRECLRLYPCDLLFVHRDAEKEPAEQRFKEVRRAVEAISDPPPHVCVVPVRMTEAWLLFDVAAIRRAAGNPNGQTHLDLPTLGSIEAIPDPKRVLRELLTTASGLSGRRLKNFSVPIRRVASLIDDFTPLRQLSAFRTFETALEDALRRLGGPCHD